MRKRSVGMLLLSSVCSYLSIIWLLAYFFKKEILLAPALLALVCLLIILLVSFTIKED